jgi:hypothetical protein
MSPEMGNLLIDEVVPRLRAALPSVPFVGHEDREEVLADMTANAAKMMDSAEKAGKKFSAGNVAYFASRAARSGRRSTWSGRTDVMSAAASLDRSVRFEHLDGDPDGGRSTRQPRADLCDGPEGLHEIAWVGTGKGVRRIVLTLGSSFVATVACLHTSASSDLPGSDPHALPRASDNRTLEGTEFQVPRVDARPC